jgi:hypothetical protein
VNYGEESKMKTKYLTIVILFCIALGAAAEGEAEYGTSSAGTATAASVGARQSTGLAAVLAGSVLATTASGTSASPGKEQILQGVIETYGEYPVLRLTDGNAVRLEGEIARQLAYGHGDLYMVLSGYFFPSGNDSIGVSRFVVTDQITSVDSSENGGQL